MTQKEKIIRLCQNPDLTGWDLIKAVEKELIDVVPYDHRGDSALESCGLEKVEFALSFMGSLDEAVEHVERKYTKREIIFAFLGKLKDGSSCSSKRVKTDDLSAMLSDLLKKTGIKPTEIEISEDTCDEEDSSECYKCPIKNTCKKFK